MRTLIAAALAYCLSYVTTPAVTALSWKIGAVDIPADWRRMHFENIPRGGGMAIFFAFFVCCLAFGEHSIWLNCTLGGGILMLGVGLIDDVVCLGAWSKFFFQFAVATASVLGCGLESGRNVFFSILWVLLLTNAHNFIDGLDGLFAGCAALEGSALGLLYFLLGRTDAMLPPLVLALACLAFRTYNRYPAQIFAGDCGSGTVGFLFGMLSLPLFYDFSIQTVALAPLFLFAYPLTDLVTAVLRRLCRGKSPFAADRGHLHHRICAAGLTQVQCGGVLQILCVSLCIVGVLLGSEDLQLFAGIGCLGAVIVLLSIRHFILDLANR